MVSPKVTPGKILRNLDGDIASIQIDIRELKNDLLEFQDIKKLKAWLKGMRQQPKMDYLTIIFNLLIFT